MAYQNQGCCRRRPNHAQLEDHRNCHQCKTNHRCALKSVLHNVQKSDDQSFYHVHNDDCQFDISSFF